MGKITYGIKLAKSSPFSIEIKLRKIKLIQYQQEKNEKLVGRVLLDLAELYLNQADYVENEDLTRNEEHYIQQDLEECLTYCKRAIKLFENKKMYRYLAKTYLVMIQCYHKIPDFENGVHSNTKLLRLFNPKSEGCLRDNVLHQKAFKLMADAYFNHAHAERGIKRFKDFKYSEQFYEREKKKILKMTADGVDADKLILKDMLRSCNFNLGVIKSKLSYDLQDITESKKMLMESIQDAKLMKDASGERKTWWEMGNLHIARGEWESALDCRLHELELIEKYHLSDYINVVLDIAKIYIMLENYSDCMESCRGMRSWVEKKMKGHKINENEENRELSNNDTEVIKKKEDQIDVDAQHINKVNDLIQSTIDTSNKIRDQRKKINQFINTCNSIKIIIDIDDNNVDDYSQFINHHLEYKKICCQIMEESLTLAELYNEMGFGRAILNIMDLGLKYCSSALENKHNRPFEEVKEEEIKEDNKNTNEELRVLELELLETKANMYIDYIFTSLTFIEELNQHIIENTKKYITDHDRQMDILIDSFERFTHIYYYFSNDILFEKWMNILEDAKKDYKQMVFNEEEIGTELDHPDGDIMDTDSENKSDIDEDDLNEVEISSDTEIKNSVLVSMNLKDKKQHLLVPIYELQKSMEWFTSEVSKLIWEKYSIDPNINYFTLNGEQLPVDMTLDSLLMKPIENFEANITGYNERSISDIYENICKRLKAKKNLKVIKALNEQSLPCVIDLRGTGLTADDIDSLISFLNTITIPFDQIDLSANLLEDDDIIKLFDAIPCPAKIILNNNLLTLKSFDYFSKHENLLTSFDFSYNMFWSISQKQISHFHSKHSNLDHFLFDGYTIINDI